MKRKWRASTIFCEFAKGKLHLVGRMKATIDLREM